MISIKEILKWKKFNRDHQIKMLGSMPWSRLLVWQTILQENIFKIEFVYLAIECQKIKIIKNG